jgi:acetylornithine deacetylase/succinyl-diaminopimelate desuccinylase-like protein
MNELLKKIDIKRMADDIWTLVSIPSPTGNERTVALKFAEMLERTGADVRVDESLSESPSVIGSLKGNRAGSTLQLAGHIDHIDVPHSKPVRDKNIISGRGSADMKSGLAAILEIVRVLKGNGCDFPGQLLITVYGRHEAPAGKSEGLCRLIDHGVFGDAAIVFETEHDLSEKCVVQGKGQSIWQVNISRGGKVLHELNARDKDRALLQAAVAVTAKLEEHNNNLKAAGNDYALLAPESIFTGQLHYGDFYNRVPISCMLQGTYRWHPCRNFSDVQEEFEKIIKGVKCPGDITMETRWTFVGESYEVDPGSPIVRAQRKAHESITGSPMELGGISAVIDANRLVPLANVPTVLCGFDNEFAHADYEYVRIERLERPCRTALLTVMNYLESAAGKNGLT